LVRVGGADCETLRAVAEQHHEHLGRRAGGKEGSVLTVSVGASLLQIAARTMEARE
jgi:hypothetical protein